MPLNLRLEAYKKLPAKSFDEFKNLSRAEVINFEGIISRDPWNEPGSSPEITILKAMSGTLRDILVKTDGQIVPFTWHNSELVPPKRIPIDDESGIAPYNLEFLDRALKERKSPFMEKYLLLGRP